MDYHKILLELIKHSEEAQAFVLGYLSRYDNDPEFINPFDGELNYHYFKGWNVADELIRFRLRS